MNGKKFLAILFSFFLIFALVLFYNLFTDGWFDTFMNGGFKALYGKDQSFSLPSQLLYNQITINNKIKYIDIYGKDSQGLVESDGERKIQFQRLPQRYQKSLRKDVWDLSENSAGVSISFKTNSSKLSVKRIVKLDFSMDHMTDVGVKGIDLYYKENGRWS